MAAYAAARRDFLRSVQNPDGGWGFFPGKQSWLEPTAYATLALHGDAAADRAWRLVRSWQLPDGSWPASAQAREPHWTTALAITLHTARKVHDDPFRRGVQWLLGVNGTENSWAFRVANFIRPHVVEIDPSFKAWPWRPGTSSWVEPTAHSLVALRRAAPAYGAGAVADRIRDGERMLLERRCSDGGWNYGNRRVLGHTLPSYPETTAVALYGLAGNRSGDVAAAVKRARGLLDETRSPLAKAWLALALRTHGISLPAPAGDPSPDILVAALETLAAEGLPA
ncbi:MAG: prenyltransferase/squalene oxidase repeat-containing protein [Bryobacteraceae bacterium]